METIDFDNPEMYKQYGTSKESVEQAIKDKLETEPGLDPEPRFKAIGEVAVGKAGQE